MAELESLCHHAFLSISHICKSLKTLGVLLGPAGGFARSKGTRVALSEMLPNDSLKIHHPFLFLSWTKSVPISPYP